MRIDRRHRSAESKRQLNSQISTAALADGIKGRVCSESCDIRCPQCGSAGCQCRCSPLCPDAPFALSGDADRHPIEPAMVPLVFEMKRLGMFSPCWSCEGHLGPDGSIMKLPRLWFYCDSTLYIRLLADGVNKLKLSRRLSAAWQVIVTYSDPDNPETTFSLEPSAAQDAAMSLPALQNDLHEIARSLKAIMSDEARRLMNEARDALSVR